MAQTAILDLLAKRRDRAISIVLGVKEREADQYLPDHVKAKLRKVVLDQMNDLTDMLLDIARSLDNGDVVLNEIYLEKIDRMHAALIGDGSGPS